MKTEEIRRILPRRLRERITEEELLQAQEIRLRCGQPVALKGMDGSLRLMEERLSARELREAVSFISEYSLYAFEEELRQGYLTLEGGHRVGFCGKAVLEGGEIRTLKQINALNIRIARQQKGWAEAFLPKLMEGKRFCHTLIVSPPCCGKTTLLRDMVRCLSERHYAVGVVDERGEICPLRDGVPQMDVGCCTDVLEGCPKAKGMVLLLRSMSPQIIAVDELGGAADAAAVGEVLRCGVQLLATAHGYGYSDVRQRLKELVDAEIFERYLVLSDRRGTGTLEAILDKKGAVLERGDGG
ncbi:MAG: stage III sporulation protein AA [Bacillota bacterium]|nr:stage III sporulation protein AA [Bacillota bacterium]